MATYDQDNALRADLLLLINVLHRLTATFRALKLGHPTLVVTKKFGPANDDINDHFIDQVF